MLFRSHLLKHLVYGLAIDEVLEQMASESTLKELTSVESIVWGISVLLDPNARAMAGSTLFMDSGRRHGLP